MLCESGIDWAATGSMLSGLGAIGAALAALWALTVSYPEWRRRETFKAQSADARSILATFYEGRQVIDSIRSPFTYGHEIDEAQKIIEDSPQLRLLPDGMRRRHQQRIVSQLRIGKHAEYWEQVFKLLPMAKAVFDEEVETDLLAIIRARQAVSAAADVYPHADDNRMQWEEKFWKGLRTPDPIDSELDSAALRLRSKLSEYLHSQS